MRWFWQSEKPALPGRQHVAVVTTHLPDEGGMTYALTAAFSVHSPQEALGAAFEAARLKHNGIIGAYITFAAPFASGTEAAAADETPLGGSAAGESPTGEAGDAQTQSKPLPINPIREGETE